MTAQGRITHRDLGIWSDRHVEPLARIARFVPTQGAVAGIQLAHAGRKASCDPPWSGGALKTPEQQPWTVVPQPGPVQRRRPDSRGALDERGIADIIAAFAAAAGSPSPRGSA